MSDTPQPMQLEQKTDPTVLGSVNFNKKKQYSVQDLLQTLKTQAFKFNSFEELKSAAFEVNSELFDLNPSLSLSQSSQATMIM